MGALGGAMALSILGGAFLYHNSLQSKVVNPGAPADPSLSSLVSAASAQAQSTLSSTMGSATASPDTNNQVSSQPTAPIAEANLQSLQQSVTQELRPVLQSPDIPQKVKEDINKTVASACTDVNAIVGFIGQISCH
jgi:DNA-binding transcriptional regulator YbjK